MQEATMNTVLQENKNFFLPGAIANEYKNATVAIEKASMPVQKKVYKSMNKMLQECFFVGSLKYGNNFIA